MSAPVLVEVCIDSVAGALAAERAGAGRVELCAGLVEGGTTPSAGSIAAVVERAQLPVVVLVRPRAGDFLYDDAELDVMRRDILAARAAGAAGVAIGVLTAEGRVDRPAMRALMAAARPMAVTMHRAIDLSRDPGEALDDLLALGVDRVLTSGGAPTALEGHDMLRRLVAQAAGGLTVMAGGRVTADVARTLVRETGVHAVHVRGAAMRESAMRHRTACVTFGKPYVPDEYRWPEVSEEAVREVVERVRSA